MATCLPPQRQKCACSHTGNTGKIITCSPLHGKPAVKMDCLGGLSQARTALILFYSPACRAGDICDLSLCAGAVIGSVSGITSWLVTAQLTQGSISILNTEANAPLLAGNLISNMLSLILVVSITLIFPEGRFDWEILKEKITSADDEVGNNMHLRSQHACIHARY